MRSWLALTRRPGSAAALLSLRPRSGRIIACGRSAPWSKIPAMSRFDWQGGSFGCRSGPNWRRFSVLAFAAGSAPSEHNIVAGYGPRIDCSLMASRQPLPGFPHRRIPRLNSALPSVITMPRDACPLAPDRSLLQLGILDQSKLEWASAWPAILKRQVGRVVAESKNLQSLRRSSS